MNRSVRNSGGRARTVGVGVACFLVGAVALVRAKPGAQAPSHLVGLVDSADDTLGAHVTAAGELDTNDAVARDKLASIDGRLAPMSFDPGGDLKVSVQGTSSVAVSNFPATQSVTGTVAIGNLPAVQSISGHVTVDNAPAVQNVSGAVSVTNFPPTQSIAGNVSVSNFPPTQNVSGQVVVGGRVEVSNLPATQPVSGTVNVGNFPATQPVSGTVSVGNFPATQQVSGMVAVANFPATQNVNVTGGAVAATTKTVGLTYVTPDQVRGFQMSGGDEQDVLGSGVKTSMTSYSLRSAHGQALVEFVADGLRAYVALVPDGQVVNQAFSFPVAIDTLHVTCQNGGLINGGCTLFFSVNGYAR